MLQSLPPVAAADARVLILGSMPGAASLAAQRYYAHPRNQFWPLICGLLGGDPAAAYPQRLAWLTARGLALWDVFARCERQGSLDSAIALSTAQVNDLPGFVQDHRQLRLVLTNGTLADAALRRHFPQLCAALPVRRMPSTSPAHASRSLPAKQAQWACLLDALGD